MSKFKSLLLAHHAGDSHATRVAVKQFTDNVARRTDGQLTIADVLNSTMGTMPALLRMVIDGAADMALPTNDRLSIHSSKFDCINIPFAFENHAHADRVLDGEFTDWIQPDMDKLGLTFLGTWDWGFRQITNSRRPILHPEDMRGLKIRVPLIPKYRDAVLALGGTPTWIEYSQLHQAIQEGLVDGQENPVAVIHALGIQHHQKYLSMLNYSYGTLALIVNRKSFDSLTPEQQLILREESTRAGQSMRQLLRSQEAQQLDEFAHQGVCIDTPDPAPFRAALKQIARSAGRPADAENTEFFLDMVERHRQ